MFKSILYCFSFTLLFPLAGLTQDTLLLTGELLDGRSIADHFSVGVSEESVSIEWFLKSKGKGLVWKQMKGSEQNFDFTAKTYFLDFVLNNKTGSDQKIVFETARPVTNEVTLFSEKTDYLYSGDAIPFKDRAMPVQSSAFLLNLKKDEERRIIVRIKSDGESLVLPVRFWESDRFYQHTSNKWFIYGIYYGIFIFVTIIYLTFYVQLRDKLFLTYTLYVFLSGLLQFALDGYMYRFVFSSGGYFADHMVIVIAGGAVFFALQYASDYLRLKGKNRKITNWIERAVLLTIALSLFNGKVLEVCYVAINAISLLAVIYVLILSFRVRRLNPDISPLYVIGMLALLLGATIFIVGNTGLLDVPEVTQYGLKAGALVETIFLSILMAGKYKSMQDEKERAQTQLLVELEEKNKLISESNVKLEAEVKARTREIEEQRSQLKEKNEDFVASIKYAERLQKALLTDEVKFRSVFEDTMIFFRPRDIVSGDFYWAEEIRANELWPDGLKVFAVADCTGHGVPGAFVSIVCNNLLKMAATSPKVNYPGEALNLIDRELQVILNSGRRELLRDGMDVALVAIDPKRKKAYFSGARSGLLIVRKGEEIILRPDKRPVGYKEESDEQFVTQEIDLESGDMLYAFSDGYPDQFGGPKGKKFLSKRLRELLCENASHPGVDQETILAATFDSWRGKLEQVDDVLVVGVRFIIH